MELIGLYHFLLEARAETFLCQGLDENRKERSVQRMSCIPMLEMEFKRAVVRNEGTGRNYYRIPLILFISISITFAF